MSRQSSETFWTRLTGNQIPKHHIFLDTESDYDEPREKECTIRHTAKLICAKYCRFQGGTYVEEINGCFGASWRDFWHWVRRYAGRGTVWLWGHNISFDSTVTCLPRLLFEGFIRFTGLEKQIGNSTCGNKGGGSIKYFLPDNECFVCDIEFLPGREKIRLVDTCNFWKIPLWKLGEQLNLPKLSQPLKGDSDAKWREYCQRDVQIVSQAVRRLLCLANDGVFGPIRPTVGGLAFATFRKSYLTRPVCVVNNSLLRRFERTAYCGGQTECYYFGRRAGLIYQLDVCSLYPSIACEINVPTRAIDFDWRTRTEATTKIDLDENCIADVFVQIKDREVPLKTEQKTHYFTGSFWTVLCGKELKKQVDLGNVLKVASVVRYDTYPLLKRMFSVFLKKRETALESGDEFTAQLLKNLCNSLIGKIGAKGNHWQTLGYGLTEYWCNHETHWDDEKQTIREFRTIAGWTQEAIENDSIETSFPAIPAFITSAARERMRDIRHIAGHQNTFYQATDCIHVNPEGFSNLMGAGFVANRKAGLLDLKSESTAVEYRGPNFYCWGHQWVTIGISGRAVKTKARHYTDYIWESLASALCRSPDDSFHVQKLMKVVKPRKIDGYIRSDKRVTRFHFLSDRGKRPREIALDFWKGDLKCT